MEISLRTHLIYAAIIGELYFILLLSIAYNLNSTFSFGTYFPKVTLIILPVLLPILTAFFLYIANFGARHITSLFQYGKFVLVGVLNTLVDLGMFNILVILAPGVSGIILPAFKAVSFLVAVTNSYMWNKYWVFKEEGERNKPSALNMGEASYFFAVSIGGLIVNLVTFAAAVSLLSIVFSISTIVAGNISALAAALASMVWNFTGYKFLVFKN